jgi:Pentapeptide repeats (8 copies)
MAGSAELDFTNQNLRDRSFKGRVLNGANFSGADIRGCNFRRSQLIGANFVGARVGVSPRQGFLWSLFAVGVGWVLADALTRLILGAVGQIPGQSAWAFVLLLYAVLIGAGLAATLGATQRMQSATRLAGVLVGALLGFFYAGTFTQNNPQAALIGMIVGGGGMGLVQWRVRWPPMAIATATANALMTYGATFMLSATASATLSTQPGLVGMLWGGLTVLYLGFTLITCRQIRRAFQAAAGTSFYGADLTDAKFDRTRLHNTDFSKTVGYTP